MPVKLRVGLEFPSILPKGITFFTAAPYTILQILFYVIFHISRCHWLRRNSRIERYILTKTQRQTKEAKTVTEPNVQLKPSMCA